MRGGGGGGMGRGGGARRGGAPSGAATQCEHGSGSVVSGVQCIIVRAQLRQTEGRRGSPARSGDAAAAAERMSRGGGRVWQLVTPSEGGGFQEVRDVVLFALGNEGGRACALMGLPSLCREAGPVLKPGARRNTGQGWEGGASRGISMDAHAVRRQQGGRAEGGRSCALMRLPSLCTRTGPVPKPARGKGQGWEGGGVERQIDGRACGALAAVACGGVWRTGVVRTREA